MTGTMHGILIYRLQDELKKQGLSVSYQILSKSLVNALIGANKDIPKGDSIEFPNGQAYRKV